MGIESGALKYFIAAYFVPGPYYIFGGTILWFLDILSILGSRNFQELMINAFAAYFDIPTSLEEFFVQHFVGAMAATVLWVIGMIRYHSS